MNILGVGAHFDDLELGCSGTLINHVEKGDMVIMLVVTNSAYHDENGKMVRGAEDAMQEGIRAAELIGARMICLEYDTFQVPFNEDLTSKIHKVINDNKIDAIYSHWIHDIHRDHEFVGRCTLMAGRHVPRFLMYRSNHYDSIQAFPGNIYSDISSVMERKIEVIKAHRSELERVRYAWVDFFTHQNQNDGQKIGVEYAEAFEAIRYRI